MEWWTVVRYTDIVWHLSVSVPSGIGKTLREQNVIDHELENWIEKNLIVKINVRFVLYFSSSSSSSVTSVTSAVPSLLGGTCQ